MPLLIILKKQLSHLSFKKVKIIKYLFLLTAALYIAHIHISSKYVVDTVYRKLSEYSIVLDIDDLLIYIIPTHMLFY